MFRFRKFVGNALVAGALIAVGPSSVWAQHHGGGGHAAHAGGHASHASAHVSRASAPVSHVNGHVAHVNPAPHVATGHVNVGHPVTAWHGGHPGTAWHGNYYHPNYDHHYRYPYGAFFGLNAYPWWNSYYPAYNYYAAPDYPAYYDDGYYDPALQANPDYSANYAPDVTLSANVPNAPSSVAQLQVVLPTASAQVSIEGQPTTNTGKVRFFDSPPLEAGKTYAYHISATWEQNGKPVKADKTVQVTAGKQFVVDFGGTQ